MFRLYLQEIRCSLKSFIIWALCLLLIIVACAIFYTKLLAGKPDVMILLEIAPEFLTTLFGLSALADLSTVGGFLSLLLLYPTYLMIFQAGFMGARVISREEEGRTVDFLYSMPHSRSALLLTKALAAFTLSLLLNLLTFFALRFFFEGPEANSILRTYFITNLLLQFSFISIGMACATLCRNPYRAGVYTGWLMFAMLILAKVLDILNSESILWILTPLHYFLPEFYILQGGVPLLHYILIFVVIIVANLITYLLYPRKDLRIIR